MVPIINWYRPKMPDYNVNIPLIIWCHGCALFSTINHDNDILSGKNCAVSYRGAWWYQACFSYNLNGPHIPITPIPLLTPWQHDLSWLRFWLTWLKFSQSEANPQKLRKFCPTKFLSIRYLLFAEQEHMLLIHEGLALIYQQRTTSKFDKTEVLRLSNMYPTIPCVSSNGGGLSWQVCH